MLDIFLFRISAILLLFNAFLVSSKLPNSLFTTKELGLLFGVGFVCIFALIKILFAKNFKVKIKIADVAVVMLLIVLPWCMAPPSKVVNHSVILTQTAVGCLYLTIRILCANIRKVILVNMIIQILVVLLCCQLILAGLQEFSVIRSYYPGFRATGMFFNPGPFAIFIAALLVFLFPVFLKQLINKNYLILIFYAFLIIFSLYFVISSLSRSAWLGGLSGLMLASILILLPKFKIPKTTRLLVFFGCLLIAIPFFYWLFHYKAESAVGRVLAWKVSILMLKDHWFTGVGLGNFAAHYIDYQAFFFNKTPENIKVFGNIAGDNRYAFNDILHILVENGIIGLLLFIAVLCLFIRPIIKLCKQTEKGQNILAVAGSSSLVTILVSGLTSYPLSMLPIEILFWFLIAVIVSIYPQGLVMNRNITIQKSFAIVALFIASSIFLSNSFNKLYTYQKWRYISSFRNEEKKIESMLNIYCCLNNSSAYLNDLAQLYVKKKEYANAIVYLIRAIHHSPNKEYYYNLGKCYEKLGRYDDAFIQFKKVNDAMPKLLKPRYLIAKLYYRKNDLVLFKRLAMEAINFKPKINSEEVVYMKNDLQNILSTIQIPNF